MGSIKVAVLEVDGVELDVSTEYDLVKAINDVNYSSVEHVTMSSAVKTIANSSPEIVSGMSINPVQGTHLITFNGQYSSTINSVTAQAVVDLAATCDYLNSLAFTNKTHAPAFGSSETLFAGVYTINGASSLAGTLILDGQGNQNSLFVFRTKGAFSTGASSSITLINSAQEKNIFFIAEGAIGIAALSNLKGTFIAQNAAVDVGANCNITGRVCSTSGAISINTSTITKPSASTIVPMGSINGFAIFTTLGAVSNTGASFITGDIGTNGGAITGFTTSVVNGTIYIPSAASSIISFGVYINGILVLSSDRVVIRTLDVQGDVMQLSAKVLIGTGEAVEIRIRVTIGTITVGNRSLTSLRVAI